MNQIVIIIPTHNNLPGLIRTLDSIKRNILFTDYRIIVVESNCTDGTAEMLDYLQEPTGRITVIHANTENSIKAVNLGINSTKDEDIYITHDDVIIPEEINSSFLKDMQTMSIYKNIGIIGTVDSVKRSGADYLDGLIWIGTWSLFIPRRTIKEIGILDENMKIGEDIDYAYRVQKEGMIAWQFPTFVTHTQMRVTPHQDQSEDIKKEAAKYFREKHGIT